VRYAKKIDKKNHKQRYLRYLKTINESTNQRMQYPG